MCEVVVRGFVSRFCCDTREASLLARVYGRGSQRKVWGERYWRGPLCRGLCEGFYRKREMSGLLRNEWVIN